jgi:hypothetical protein
MAAWVEDDPWNLWSGWPGGSKESFWSNLPLALAYSDQYVWVWSEHTRYGQASTDSLNPFLASLRNRTFNTGREEVVALTEDFSTDPMARGWHFDFDMLAIGRKKTPSQEVPLMTPDAVPYVWDRTARGVRVRGESSSGSVDQRRRYVHPIQPVNPNQSIGAELDFEVDTFGECLDDPIVLGLFSSEQPVHSASLSLQIAGPNRVRVVLAEKGEPQTFPLSIPGGIKTDQTYRFAIEFDGATGRLQTSLIELSSGASHAVQIQNGVVAASERFTWDELGIALWEAAPVPMPSQKPYRYLLVKAICRR